VHAASHAWSQFPPEQARLQLSAPEQLCRQLAPLQLNVQLAPAPQD